MISANDLRNVKLSSAADGYSVEEVDAVLSQAASTIDAYSNENKELYHKMEVLASKIEEYRAEEDSIKTALITAQKMADKIKQESTEEADALLASSRAEAQNTVLDANEKAEKIVSEARQFASDMLKEKTEEADSIVADAEKKANDAISSSKIVAQNILDQAKEISDDLITKSKDEKEAYETLIQALKQDAAEFIANLKGLYSAQLEKLETAKLETDEPKADENEVDSIHGEVDSLVNEIDEIAEAIPDEISIDREDYSAPEPEEETSFELIEEDNAEPEALIEEIVDEEPEEEEIIAEEEITEDEINEEEIEPEDAMAAVEAFSRDEITPIDTSRRIVPEIDEEPQMEKSLFDSDEKLPFETYFKVSKNDAHGDKTQTISLVPPEEEDDDEPKFRGFFRKKK